MWHELKKKKIKRERNRKKQTWLHTQTKNGREQNTNDSYSRSEESAYHSPNKVMPCTRFQPFRRKAGLYHTHLPLIGRTSLSNHSNWVQRKNHLHPQKQSSSPRSLENQTKTKKSLLNLPPPGQTLTPLPAPIQCSLHTDLWSPPPQPHS